MLFYLLLDLCSLVCQHTQRNRRSLELSAAVRRQSRGIWKKTSRKNVSKSPVIYDRHKLKK